MFESVYNTGITNIFYVLFGVLVVGGVGVLSLKLHAVDFSGFLAGLVVGLAVWIFGNWAWFLVILTFFIVSAIFTKFKYERKRRLGAAQEKGGARAWTNVIANGGLAAFLAVMEGLFLIFNPIGRYDIFFAGFIGVVATAAADTLATEIGLLNPHPPRLITNLRKKVVAGSSGGVSLMGELAILMGGLITGGVALLLQHFNLLGTGWLPWLINILNFGLPLEAKLMIIALGAGFIGSTADSLIGATVQALYKCPVCGKITEHDVHCGEVTIHLRGHKAVDNNVVNLVSTAIGAISAFAIYLLLF
ncbi:MAG: DUF92 domain-containing protein [Candidatus Jordarchaeaceae archaeon]